VAALREVNRLPGSTIRAGDWLLIPVARTDIAGGPPVARGVSQRVRYTVRKGDSLWHIARRFGVSTTDLVRWNKLSRDKYLQPGQRLTLYVDVTRVAEAI
jgi:membrane-bound lytic murein transglycosylase D